MTDLLYKSYHLKYRNDSEDDSSLNNRTKKHSDLSFKWKIHYRAKGEKILSPT